LTEKGKVTKRRKLRKVKTWNFFKLRKFKKQSNLFKIPSLVEMNKNPKKNLAKNYVIQK
jgi:hypothetical protein